MKKNVEKWDWIKNKKKIKKNNRNKKTRTKLDIKIKWNKLLMDETTKKNQPQKDLKSKTNSNKKNNNQNWYKYKLTWNIWFLKWLVWNLRLGDKRKRRKKMSFKPNCCFVGHTLLPNRKRTMRRFQHRH
jgi:hypothetical protein